MQFTPVGRPGAVVIVKRPLVFVPGPWDPVNNFGTSDESVLIPRIIVSRFASCCVALRSRFDCEVKQ